MSVRLSQLADHWEKLELHGEDKVVTGFAHTQSKAQDEIAWVKNSAFLKEIDPGIPVLTEDQAVLEKLRSTNSVLFANGKSRYAVALLHTHFFKEAEDYENNTADEWRKKGIKISEFTFIGRDVEIGEGTVIGPNVTITNGVRIGKHCNIEPNTVIGAEGMGLEWDGEQYLSFPQLGKVIVGDHCLVGPLSTIRKGALVDTTVGSHTKIGSLNNIGHNVQIGDGVLVTTCCCVGGSSKVGDRSFLGMGAIIRNKVTVGNEVLIGQGCVVIKDVEPKSTVVGNPARVLEN